MKVGIKVYSDGNKAEYAKKACGFADFIEVLVVPGIDMAPFRSIEKPMVIHAAHEVFKCNPADKTRFDYNMDVIKQATKAADMLDAKIIVLHPGYLASDDCSFEQAVKTIAEINDPRIALENLPMAKGFNGKLCSLAEDMRKLMDATGNRMCLDFGHACAAANYLGRNYKPIVDDFLKLKPAHFHLSDGNLNKILDDHRPLFEGNYPLDHFKSLIPKDAWVTLETPQNLGAQKRECEFMRR